MENPLELSHASEVNKVQEVIPPRQSVGDAPGGEAARMPSPTRPILVQRQPQRQRTSDRSSRSNKRQSLSSQRNRNILQIKEKPLRRNRSKKQFESSK